MFSNFLVSENKNIDLILIYSLIPNMYKYWTILKAKLVKEKYIEEIIFLNLGNEEDIQVLAFFQ